MVDTTIGNIATQATALDGDELIEIEDDPSGTPTSKKATVALLRGPIVHVRDEKAQNTAGGTFTSGAWQTRTLNTVKTNTITGASLASNQVTLPAGTYEVDAVAPAFFCGRHQARLQNITAGSTLIAGSSMYEGTTGDISPNTSLVRGRFTLAAQSAVELQHQCQTSRATNGFGVAANFGTEVYAEAFIRKVG